MNGPKIMTKVYDDKDIEVEDKDKNRESTEKIKQSRWDKEVKETHGNSEKNCTIATDYYDAG